ncbi:hypothetical protein [Phyllobacterium zundukense]|uniref:Uncharacterized protein n=1 Tax=Phyllobacterium zundukense TaxID=1867719 RepID=A0A2N9W4V5_9HYPH|nr:hypothetical protein [Phyllobacterium zundukense]ATU91761.1 hypothetical protein BLM14_09115 [Phyllobacterium zundukense]PIO46773.1 hypothetical protein B5P45_02960 [Phyllobacterium zundukense]
MAKTFLGQLILRLQDEMSGKAKKAATDVTGSMKKIEEHARRLASANWGVSFQRQMEKIGASAKEFDQVRRSWDRLQKDLQSKNVGTALRKSEIGAWKVATLSHLAQVRQGMRSTEKEARRIVQAMRMALRPAYIATGAYSGIYMAGTLGREALTASSERQREYFRQRMADIPQNEQDQIYERSSALSQKYPSVGITDIMEMARTARNTMGSTPRGLEVLDGMVRAMVTLQSSKGLDAASDSLMRMLRGIDNLGKNSNGAVGVQNVLDIIDGLTKAAQIEGADLDPGKLFDMARRAKIAGPGLSTEFLMTTAPAFMQDMTAEGFGTALSSAFKAFVTGANDSASKVNIAEQARLDIRKGPGKGELVNSSLFGTNPYEWVKRYLVPALKADGIDMNNDTDVAKAVANLSRNSMATGMITRMITQSDQVERLIGLYGRSMGTNAADRAKDEDPFVAYRGFLESFNNLAASIGEKAMPVIVPGLNAISGAVNQFAAMIKAGDPAVSTGLAIGGIGAAGFGAYKVGSAVYGLVTAGTNLNAAAAALQRAAAMQSGGSGAGDLIDGKNDNGGKAGWFAALMLKAKSLSLAAAPGLMAEGLAYTPGSSFEAQVVQQGKNKEQLQRMLGYLGSKEFWLGKGADPNFNAKEHFGIKTGLPNAGASPQVMDEILRQSADVGKQMAESLSITAKPDIDGSGIKAALADAKELRAVLSGLGSVILRAQANVDTELRRSFADYGVSP